MGIIDKMKRNSRLWIQLAYTAITNGYIMGFAKGSIYQGPGKYVCVPGLNCYSCPGALGSCPIGALQSMLTGSSKNIPYYVVGFLMLVGVTLGRVVCGFLCPFGMVQDLLYRIPGKKIVIPKKIDKKLRYLKILVLLVFVIIFPIFLTDQFGISSPYFCKWICPSGTLFGGIPLISLNESLRANLGYLFNWKLAVLLIILISSICIYRPFCKYLCPLGVIYGACNQFSFYQLTVDKASCTNCKICERTCKMDVEVTKNINSMECIRCGECKQVCPHGCITSKVSIR